MTVGSMVLPARPRKGRIFAETPGNLGRILWRKGLPARLPSPWGSSGQGRAAPAERVTRDRRAALTRGPYEH